MIGSFASSPDFNAHRIGVAAVDSSVPTAKSNGVKAHGFRWAIIDVSLQSGSLTALDIRVLFWSEASGKFVPVVGSDYDVNSLSASTQIVVPVYSSIFWVKVDTLSGTSPVIDFYVAGFGDPSAF